MRILIINKNTASHAHPVTSQLDTLLQEQEKHMYHNVEPREKTSVNGFEGIAPGNRTYLTTELFKGSNEVRIHHRGDEYRLRITKQGKLILTK